MRTLLHKPVAVSAFLQMLVLILGVGQSARCHAQTPTQPEALPKVAGLREPQPVASDTAATNTTAPAAAKATAVTSAAMPDPEVSRDIAAELAVMKARIEQLEAKLKNREAPATAPAATAPPETKGIEPAPAPATGAANPAVAVAQQAADTAAKPEKPEPTAPFAYADWTWLNGNARNKDAVWDSKFFTPEIRFDTDYVFSFNHPKDDSLGGSTEIFRSNEIQVEQISFGGDFHWQDVRGRVLTLGGMFGVTTPRNDASAGRGQWDLRGAYKYFAEAYGGYHFNVNHGLNVDAGIFVSYIGLFSYYNFDNWAYQPSYVSSNTPWFFNGLRIQWFPTDKLKIEPWIINGWQSYGRLGTKPGLGGQILWRPKPWVSMVFNNYGMGEDTLWTGTVPLGRSRIHTDDSIEIKYYDQPTKFVDKMAFSLTGDLGCEYGGGVSCHKNEPLTDRRQWLLAEGWTQTRLRGLDVVRPDVVQKGPVRSHARWWCVGQSGTLPNPAPANQRSGCHLRIGILSGVSGLAVQSLGYFGNFHVDAQAVHQFPLGVRLSNRAAAVLHRPRWDHSSGWQQWISAILCLQRRKLDRDWMGGQPQQSVRPGRRQSWCSADGLWFGRARRLVDPRPAEG
jgi:hypothetical protein